MKEKTEHHNELRIPKEDTCYVRIYPDPVLSKESAPVKNIDGKIKEVIERMAEAMYANKGIGLAAPQTASSARLSL